ncbi:DUF58 domain-containing protein [Porticoccaceae bacterium]|jgi:uncharacterized protein (DUF58 family)|nr:DUF58 domain-containing protein [Porticoccaceae bacterium]MDB2566202.1 DUF58 domain-containing protein [Porticoccaceae bacterium]MDB2620513.1 DUF58 domain-containing protein [Porticoccaceae bacterium]MDB2669184.1 DUF58 domain-containing protein [Porticoccaceae bacterium]
MSLINQDQSHPATANLKDMVRLRYGARDLTGFPKVQARQMLAGGHKSRFRGRGMDFDQVRIYQPGDDVRSIDWRVTARTQTPHTKIFSEEREKPILVITDLRSPMFFGSKRLKSVVACEVSAALAWAGLSANDRSGGIIFGEQHQMDVKPRRSHHAVLQFIHGLKDYSTKLLDLQDQPSTDRYSMAEILDEARHFVSPGSTIFVVSDFHDLNDACEQHLFALARQGNLNLCHVFDNIEQHLPPPSLYAVSDGAQHTLLDTSNAKLRERFKQAFEDRSLRLRKLSEKLSAGLLPFNTEDTVMSTLRRAYGKKRNSRRGS